MTREATRRETLRAAGGLAGLAAAGGLAGCSGLLGGGGGELDDVPEGARAAVYVDAEAVRTDEGTERVVDAWLSSQAQRDFYDGPASFEEWLDEFEAETGLDPREVDSMTPFFEWAGGFSPVDEEFSALRFVADWSEQEVLASLEDGGESYEEAEHNGQTVHEPQSEFAPYLGVLGEDTYVSGSEDAVRDMIDVRAGDGEPMAEHLRDAYAEAQSGPVRFVSAIPESQVPESGPDARLQLEVFTEVDHATGAVYADGDVRGIETVFAAGDEETADDLASILDGAFTLFSSETRSDALADALGDVEVEQDGTDVVTAFEAPVEELVDLVYATDPEAEPQ